MLSAPALLQLSASPDMLAECDPRQSLEMEMCGTRGGGRVGTGSKADVLQDCFLCGSRRCREGSKRFSVNNLRNSYV